MPESVPQQKYHLIEVGFFNEGVWPHHLQELLPTTSPGCLASSARTSMGFGGSATTLSSRTSLKCMEATLMGMKQMRQYVDKEPGKEMLDSLIEEAGTQIAKIKRKVIQ